MFAKMKKNIKKYIKIQIPKLILIKKQHFSSGFFSLWVLNFWDNKKNLYASKVIGGCWPNKILWILLKLIKIYLRTILATTQDRNKPTFSKKNAQETSNQIVNIGKYFFLQSLKQWLLKIVNYNNIKESTIK